MTEVLSIVAYLVENCTGVVLIEHVDAELRDNVFDSSNELDEFTRFDPKDAIYQEFDPPQHLESDPKLWKQSVHTFKKSFWECLKTVLLIQTVAGSLIGFLSVMIVFLNFITVEWCFEKTSHWNEMPVSVQRLRVTTEAVEGFIIQLWDFFCILLIFPFSLIKELHLLTLNLMASFIDVTYRLYYQMYGEYRLSWKSFPLNALFCLIMLVNHYRLARYFCPNSLKKALRLDFILSSQFILGSPAAFFMVYKLFPFYVAQEAHVKILIAGASPLVSAIPKAIARIGAQRLKGIIHPGVAHVLVAVIYSSSAVVFRVLQADLTSLGLFIALGIAHAIIDLLERITITMRDHIWEYLYSLVRRQRSRQPKYRSPRSRRFIADVSIQIMMQESTALITALGFINVYQFLYNESEPLTDFNLVVDFFIRAGIGLSIDLVFNTISLLIQTRVMNVAVNRVWKKKWRHHMLVNALLISLAVLYFSEHLYYVVRSKYKKSRNSGLPYNSTNCSFPSFL